MSRPIICIKIGGRVVTDERALDQFILELKELRENYEILLIHGGGAEVSRVSRIFGLEPVFCDGIRMTSQEEMDIVDMVLSGKVNKYLVRSLFEHGLSSVGISGSDGGTVIGEEISKESRTGKVEKVSTELPDLLIQGGYIPVVSSTAMDSLGKPLTINADEVALALATALYAEILLFLSDIPGVLRGEEVIEHLAPDRIESEIEGGVIKGGMIPKVRSSAAAVNAGVGSVIIGGYEERGDLQKLLSGINGTRINSPAANRGDC